MIKLPGFHSVRQAAGAEEVQETKLSEVCVNQGSLLEKLCLDLHLERESEFE